MFNVSNFGSAPLTISAVNEPYADTWIEGFSPGLIIPAGSSATPAFTVKVDTTGMNETISREIEVVSDGHDDPPGYGSTQTLRLFGTVMPEPLPGDYEQLFTLYADSLYGLDVGDTDGDGNGEIVTLGDGGNPEVRIFERIGDDQYTQRWSHTLTTSGYLSEGVDLLRVDDINGDGTDDIVCGVFSDGASNGKLFLIQSSANDTWAVTWSSLTNGILLELITGDSDGDGNEEIVFAASETYNGPGHIYVLENNGGTSFTERLNIGPIYDLDGDPYESLGGMAIADSDRDGHNEILFACGNRAREYNTSRGDKLFIYESTGNNVYSQVFSGMRYDAKVGYPEWEVEPWEYAKLMVGDPDADGLNEIVFVENGEKRLIVIESPANDTWTTRPADWEYQAAYARYPYTVALEDVDADGVEEILVGFDLSLGAVLIEGFGPDDYVEQWQTTGITDSGFPGQPLPDNCRRPF